KKPKSFFSQARWKARSRSSSVSSASRSLRFGRVVGCSVLMSQLYETVDLRQSGAGAPALVGGVEPGVGGPRRQLVGPAAVLSAQPARGARLAGINPLWTPGRLHRPGHDQADHERRGHHHDLVDVDARHVEVMIKKSDQHRRQDRAEDSTPTTV